MSTQTYTAIIKIWCGLYLSILTYEKRPIRLIDKMMDYLIETYQKRDG